MRTVEHFAKQTKNAELSVDNIKLFDSLSREYATKLIDGVVC